MKNSGISYEAVNQFMDKKANSRNPKRLYKKQEKQFIYLLSDTNNIFLIMKQSVAIRIDIQNSNYCY